MSDAIPLVRPQRRWFTPEEANALLPTVMEHLEALVEGIERTREVNALLEQTTEQQDRWAIATDLSELQDATREALTALQELGVEIKGIQPGLVDFPAILHGQEVYLCWREGEPTVSHWHPLHTGARGRRPIEPDSAPSWEYWS